MLKLFRRKFLQKKGKACIMKVRMIQKEEER